MKGISSRKRATKNGTSIPAGEPLPSPLNFEPPLDFQPTLNFEPPVKTAGCTRKDIVAADLQSEPDLDVLLGEVNQMLTEMTHSKWLTSDWTGLHID